MRFEQAPLVSHQKLKVFGKALSQAATLAWHSSQWDKRRAIVQVGRALAEGSGWTARAERARFLDIAEASAVQAATYLDLWVSKAESAAEQAHPKLELLERVVRIVRVLLPSRSD